MARVFIVEDNMDQLTSLKRKVILLGHEVVGLSLQADNIFPELEKSNPDVILLDINFNSDNEGLVLAERIRERLDCAIIFVTALSSQSIIRQAISSDPSGYLVKPVKVNDLKASIELALHRKNEKQRAVRDYKNYITVRTGFKLRRIDFDRIILLETESKNYITLTIKDDVKAVIRNSLKAVCRNVLPPFFIQVHKQYVVNLNCIKMINEKEQMLHLENKIYIPIGRGFKKQLYSKLNLV